MNEQFSAFLDNEASRDEADSVVNSLLRDATLRDSWTRQYWIRETLRSSAGEPAVALDMDFSERVMQAIHEEAPLQSADEHPDVVPMARAHRHRRWPTMAGFAMAASAAGFAFLAVQTVPLGSWSTPAVMDGAPVSTAGMAQPTRVASAGMAATGPVAHTASSGEASSKAGDWMRDVAADMGDTGKAVDHWQVSNPVLANRLNDYLFEHNGLARGYGLGATPGLVRVATYGWSGAR